MIYGLFFYFFGGIEAIIRHDIQIYNFLLFSSFTIAGFCLTSGSFIKGSLSKKMKKKHSRQLFGLSALFILSGVLMFSNIIFVEIVKNIKETSDVTINIISNFFLIIGATGIIFFFLFLSFLIEELIEIIRTF